MSDPPKKPYVPNVYPSGEHEAVREMRAKFESIQDNQFPELERLNERVEKLGNAVSSHPPRAEVEEDLPTPSDEEDDPDAEITQRELRSEVK